jgi:3-oxoadipate enol-lactonase
LTHRLEGSGETVLLLNGIAMSIASWESVSARLAESHRVLRCDFRGQLQSPGTPPEDVAGHAHDVVALLDHLSIERVHLVATSFGGVVAALVAARWPERVHSLLSVASADGFDGVMAEEVARWHQACLEVLAGGDRHRVTDVLEPTVYSERFRSSNRAALDERRRQVAGLPDTWFEGLAGLLASASTVHLGPELSKIRCPTLVVAAEHDGFIPCRRTEALAEGISNARFEVLPGAPHAVVVEQPDELIELMGDFLAGLASGSEGE